MTLFRRSIPLTAAIALLASCKSIEPVPDKEALRRDQPPVPAKAQTPVMPPGLDETVMDTGADPCDDFYRFACGGWLDRTEIPSDRSAWSRGFATVAERNEKILRGILEEAEKGRLPANTAYADKLGDFWVTCIDEAKLESAGPEMQKELNQINSIQDRKMLADAVAHLHLEGISPVFHYGSAQDLKDATQVIADVDQGGLGMPDRDYYLKDDDKTKGIRNEYIQHIVNVFELLGDKPNTAKSKSAAIMKIETDLARASLSRVDRRDPHKLYHRLERKGLKAKAPSFAWDAFFNQVGPKDVEAVNVGHPPFFEAMNKLIKTAPISDWKTYLTWHFVAAATPGLPKKVQDENFRFQSKTFSGAKEDRPRWKKCVEYTDGALGEALGRIFVARAFGADSKVITNQMVSEIEKSFERDLESIQWMDSTTKRRALEKLQKITNKIGFPDRWRNYDGLKTDRVSFLGNLLRARMFEEARDISKIGKPVDKMEWLITPPTVNAYYFPPLNEIVFPAGILQPPYYNIEATSAVNFGAMGMVVGHETTHGFDDEGRKFDPEGNLRDWWTEASAKAFEERVACTKNEFDNEVAIDDVKVNGALTLGENVADLGGVKLALMSLNEWQRKNPSNSDPTYRYNPAQQFFLGFGQSWCSKFREENARLRAAIDPHAPPFLRVNAPLRNLPSFAEAFQCKEGSRMTKPKRCEVW